MEKTLNNVTQVRLIRDLSYKDFFDNYDPYRDGRVIGATYSFEHKHFDFWSRFEPFSVFYIAPKYREKAISFLKRFPLFLIYIVPNLHTKAFFFEESCRLLMGSQNLWSPESTFSELMCELQIKEEDREATRELIFGFDEKHFLMHEYDEHEIKIHRSNKRPFLPCHKEVTYWDLTSNIKKVGAKPGDPEYQYLGFIYVVLEYLIDGQSLYLAFDRGYYYSGELTEKAFSWLINNVKVREKQHRSFLSRGDRLPDSAPFKDQFACYHPISRKHIAQKSYYFDRVEKIDGNQAKLEEVALIDISKNKLKPPDSKDFEPIP